MIVSTAVMFGVLLVVPEPFTKLVAAAMTATLVVYLGVDTLYSLRDGWRRLVARTDAAGTFDELRSAGEQFGKLMGANAARVLVMVAAAALGPGAGGVAKVLPKLPGIGQALRFVTAEGVEVEVEAVQSAIIAKSGITLTLAPGATVASTIGNKTGGSDPGPRPSAARGGQRVPAPKELDAFPGLKRVKPKTPVQGGGALRRRWVDDKGRIYEWDSQHGTVEVYTKSGKHVGEFDPRTGQQLKPEDPTREVEP